MSPKTLETTISQDIIYISSNIHGTNTNFETYKSRFKKVNQKVHEMFDKLKNPNSNYSLNTTELDFVSRELIYMKDKKQENRFKNAIETQEDLGQIVSATETTLKEVRNHHYDKVLFDQYDPRNLQLEKLQDIVKGNVDGSYHISDRIKTLDKEIKKLNTNKMNHDQIDDLTYTLHTLKKNKYLQDKGGKKAQNVINTMEKKLSKAKEYQTINKAVYNGQHKSRIAGHIQTGGHVAKVLPLEVDLVDYKDLEAKEKQRKLKTKKYLVRGIAATIAVGILYLGINAFTNKSENPNTDKMKNTTQVVNYKH